MSLNEPSVDFHLKAQEASFTVPYELLRKRIKDIQKHDERQYRKMEDLLSGLKSLDKAQQKAKLKSIITSLKQYERKAQAIYDAERELMAKIKARLDKLKELKELKQTSLNGHDDDEQEINKEKLLSWYRDQTNLLIVDYLIRNNKAVENAGFPLLKDLKFEKLIDFDVLCKANQISNAILLNHDLGPLISWIQDNRSYLKKTKSSLEFQTRLQEFIVFVKKNEISEAVSVFTSHLIAFTQTNFNEIMSASGLFAVVEIHLKEHIPIPEKYLVLFSDDRYTLLSDLFLEIYYKLFGIPHNDPLLVYLSIGISALKTKSCKCSSQDKADLNFEVLLTKKMSRKEDDQIRNNCPVCSLELNHLGDKLPYSHNVESFLFDNPVMLPNGNIFDKIKLIKYSKTLDNLEEGSVKDPTTSEIFKTNELITMYPT